MNDKDTVVVPREPTPEMIDRFVSRALCVSVHGDGGWSNYAREQWSAMIAAAPSTSVREEVERLRSALRAIESGECVTDWADQPHEQMQDAAHAALKPSTDKGGVE